jgi:hypothetical protein
MALPSPALALATSSPLWGLWARPADRPAQIALALSVFLAVVAVHPRGPRWLASSLDFTGATDLAHLRRFLTVASFAAAFLSLGYIAFYLRGGPRAPEATTLWLQGRALSHARLAWAAPDPTASFRATGLLFAAPDRLAGVGPPAYPALLAAAFLVGAPMLVGPLLAASIVVATWWLARELAERGPATPPADVEAAGRIAVVLSIVCVALRYDTAETLPRGLATLATAAALGAALRASRHARPGAFLPAGLALGVVLAAAPASSLGVGLGVLALAVHAGPGSRARAVAWTAAGLVPGLLLVFAGNRAATGHALTWPGPLYDAALESPGARGAKAVSLAVLSHLRAHVAGVANLEPLAALALVPVVGKRRSRGVLVAAAVIGVHLVVALRGASRAGAAAGPGSPLGDVLAIEHALTGLALVAAFPRRAAAAATATVALSLAGFALHTSHDHADLAAAGGGHPRYEPDVAREAGVTHGLLFFDDDEGYALASDPGLPASHGVQAARMRGDDHDRLLYDLLGHPPIHRYLASGSTAAINVWAPPNAGSDTWRFEAESDWPPAGVVGGHARIVEGAGMCSADTRALALDPTGSAEASMLLELPAPRGPTSPPRRSWSVTPRAFVRGGSGEGTITLSDTPGGAPRATWTWTDTANGPGCLDLGERALELGPEQKQAWLRVTARGGPVALDRTTLRPR